MGQLKQNHVMITDTSINPIKLSLWIANGTEREQVTRTFYDEPITTIPDFSQDNLRNRVATVTFQEVYDTDEEVYNHASHYSYDIAGNVKTLVQDVPELEDYVQRFKRIDYEYDLISGKVNKVHYEKDSVDQFIHQYAYDEENRLIQAKTSADGLLWDIDADYQYYAHGPLARIELGERQVQGIDYAYTLQGWLKGINGLDLNLYRDMGRDGNTGASANKKVGRDVYGMVIGYFEDDYYPAGGNSRNFEPSYSPSSFSSASPSLYNGNIRNIGYTIKGLTPLTIGYAYKYDQLNRLAEVKPYDTFNSSNYKWTTSGSAMTSYKEELSYDANGNILTYLRKGAPSQVNMDNMTYNYVSGTNKLVQVEDAVSASNYSIDIDQQVSTNYLYDNSGNLIKDKKEKLDITWTAYGKVDSIYNDITDLAINFDYDASQNRLSKRVITTASSDTVTSYYIRDAQGNIMAIYELRDDTVRWIEQDLYGSSRLGVLNPDSVVYPPTTYSQFFHHLQGKKQYELTNHLGNVLTTINDRKIGQDTATGDGLYDYWVAAQISGQDYYSGGMVMPDRSFSYENYGFGFNGKELDNEIKGSGNSLDFGNRIYDSRINRWLSVDPLQAKYPNLSPYNAFENNPIYFNDPTGKDARVTIKGKDITISTTIYIYGSGATSEKTAEMQTAIMGAWSKDENGKSWSYTDKKSSKVYSVKFDIRVEVYNTDNPTKEPGYFSGDYNPLNTDNFIKVTKDQAEQEKLSDKNGPEDLAFVVGGDEGVWRADVDKSVWAHEVGHLFGLIDRYIARRIPKVKYYDDEWEILPQQGWEGNVMGAYDPGNPGKVQQRNIDEMIKPIVEKCTDDCETKIDP